MLHLRLHVRAGAYIGVCMLSCVCILGMPFWMCVSLYACKKKREGGWIIVRESGRKKEEELGTEKNDRVNLGAIL